MGCERVDFPGGMAFACSRGVKRERCDTPGCGRPSVALCDWLLAGKKAGKTCDRRMCEGCRTSVGEDRDYCPAHARATEAPEIGEPAAGETRPRVGRRVAVVGSRSFRALHLVRDLVLALPVDTTVVSGHAAGVDVVAEIVARQRDLPTVVHPVRRAADGVLVDPFTKAAMARNTLVADDSDDGDAFVNAESRGTWDTVQKLRGLGKVVRIHEEPPSAEHSLLFYTAPHPRTRQAPKGYRGPCMLDVSRGSGGVAGDPFAPSLALLSEAKRRSRDGVVPGDQAADMVAAMFRGDFEWVVRADEQIEEAEKAAFAWYEPRYREEMLASWRTKRAAWDALLARNVVVLCCYCPTRDRCHRGLLAGHLVKAGAHVGRRVVDGGEVPCW